MEVIIKFGCPFAVDSTVVFWLFLLLPAIFAAIGASLLQGSFLRIVGGAMGGGLRDFLVLFAVNKGWVTVTNPDYELPVSFILIFFGASGGALGSCLAPYRGKFLMLNSAIGGFLGQFCLPFVLFWKRLGRARSSS
jgi:hypothetical protein